MGIMPAELQRRGVFRKGIQRHPEEIDVEFAVDVMEFVLAFAVVFFQVHFVHLLQFPEIIRAFQVNAFMDNEVFAVFDLNEGVSAMRASEMK